MSNAPRLARNLRTGRIELVGGIDPGAVAAAARRQWTPPEISGRGQRQHEISGAGVIVGPSAVAPSHGRDLVAGLRRPQQRVGQAVPSTPGSTALLGGSTYQPALAPTTPPTAASACSTYSGLGWLWCRIVAFFTGL